MAVAWVDNGPTLASYSLLSSRSLGEIAIGFESNERCPVPRQNARAFQSIYQDGSLPIRYTIESNDRRRRTSDDVHPQFRSLRRIHKTVRRRDDSIEQKPRCAS